MVFPEKMAKAYLISKVSCLCHVAEQPDFHDAREQLYPCHNLQEIRMSRSHGIGELWYLVGVLHDVRWERGIDDEVAIVRNDGSSFRLGHSERRVRRAESVVQILQDFGVCKRDDFYGDAWELLRTAELDRWKREDMGRNVRWCRGTRHFSGSQQLG